MVCCDRQRVKAPSRAGDDRVTIILCATFFLTMPAHHVWRHWGRGPFLRGSAYRLATHKRVRLVLVSTLRCLAVQILQKVHAVRGNCIGINAIRLRASPSSNSDDSRDCIEHLTYESDSSPDVISVALTKITHFQA